MNETLAMRIGFVFLLIAAIYPACSAAGPWPREKGAAFFSTSIEVSRQPHALNQSDDAIHHVNQGYLEYGLRPKLSIGANVTETSGVGVDLELFVGVNVLQRGPHALSVELAASRRYIQLPSGELVLSDGYGIGLAYGRGLTLFGQGGWATVELHHKQADHYDETKLDATLGLKFDNGWMALAQVFNSRIEGELYTKIAPSVVVPLGEKNKMSLGLRVPTDDTSHSALQVGFWQEF